MTPRPNIKYLEDGRVCIHWFHHDPDGPIKTRLRSIPTQIGQLNLGGASGWIACNPEQNTVYSQQRGNEYLLCIHSPEPTAVTCPNCMATKEYVAAVAMNQDNKAKSG